MIFHCLYISLRLNNLNKTCEYFFSILKTMFLFVLSIIVVIFCLSCSLRSLRRIILCNAADADKMRKYVIIMLCLARVVFLPLFVILLRVNEI